MKQTSVEWLEEEMSKTYIFNQDDFDMFKKAKEMEKQQIFDAHLTGLIHPLEIEATKQSEQYYNETFKNK